MTFTALLVLTISLTTLLACESASNERPLSARNERSLAAESDSQVVQKQEMKATESEQRLRGQGDAITTQAGLSQPVSLREADSANTASLAFDRKIIRNANLTVEVTSATDSQRKIVAIAESHQGFVVTSEATQKTSGDRAKPEITVNLVVRVPAAQFNQVMEEVRAVGARVTQEKVSGQDVTEEFMDLEARIKNQKALEMQFLEIMKRASKVEDALSVQSELASVRTEIEKLEGRRRFLENQSSLSTINITLQPPPAIVNATGFWYNARSAFADGVDVAAGIILFAIRAIIALLPVIFLIVLPLALIARLGLRVVRRRRATATATAGVSE